MGRTALNGLKNEDYTDRELLHILNDVADGDGWASTFDIAAVLPIKHPDGEDHGTHASRCVASRFAWMTRYGWVERDESRTKWRLTRVGRDLMNGKLNKSFQTAMDKLSPGDRVLVVRAMGAAFRTGSPEAATMLRREWLHGARRAA